MNVACIGIGGQGWFNLRAVSRYATVVALCDVDHVALSRASKHFPHARVYTDYRRLYDDHSLFDSVVISTPDHAHAILVSLALEQGKHCFCEKPLATNLSDLRRTAKVLSQCTSITCLGCQGVYSGRYAYLIQWLKQAQLGPLVGVVAWSDRPGTFWHPTPARMSVTAKNEGEIDWPTWLMARPYADFSSDLHPMAWRNHSAYGTGAIGDMGPHLLALPLLTFAFDQLSDARIIEVESRHGHAFSTSLSLHCLLEYHGRPVSFLWYHGRFVPSDPIFSKSIRRAENGIILRYELGTVYCPEWNACNAFVITEHNVSRIFDDVVPRSCPDIFESWLRACANGERTETDFESFGTPLMNILLPLIELDRRTAAI